MSVRNKFEEKFEKRLVKKVKETGQFWCKKMTVTIPGYPDIQIMCGDWYLLAEAKFFRLGKRAGNMTNISDKFKKTQPPFYLNFLKTSKNLILVWELRTADNEIYYEATVMTRKLAKKIPGMVYQDLADSPGFFSSANIDHLVSYIKHIFLEGVESV